MHRIGLKLWSSNTGAYFNEAKRLYAEGVFDYLELYIVPDTLDTIAQWKTLVCPFIIHATHFAYGFRLSDPSKEAYNQAIYQQVKEFADALETPHIIFHGGIDGTLEETARQLAGLNEPRALIENKPLKALPSMGGGICRGASVPEIEYIMHETGCGFCLDVGHAVAAANSLGVEHYEHIADFIRLSPVMYHLSDAEDVQMEVDSHTHLGTGELDLQKLLKMLPENSTITIETDKDSDENLDDFVHDVKVLRSV